ncbi:MAG: stage III sporulation protein AE [Clostridia bacterium]|nr:stage III sporulation protein AE [Clostridia bacterium]
MNHLNTKKLIKALIIILGIFALFAVLPAAAVNAEDGTEDLNGSIAELLEGLDLSALQSYLDENSDSYLFNFGNTAREIIEYLISGNAGSDYGSYISEITSVILSDVISLIPVFAEVLAVALLSAIFAGAEGSIIGKSTSKIVRLACYSLIIVMITAALAGVVEECVSCISSLKKQMEIITPILVTLTVLTGGTSSAAIYQPAALFLSEGAVEIISGFIFPAAIASAVLNFMSKINPQINFSGVSKLLKSIMKWVMGITVTVFSLFITVQSSATSLLDGVLFKTTKYVVSNSVPIVGGFLSSGFDLLTAAGLLIKNSVGVCGIILIIAEVASPLVLLIAFSLMLKIAGAVVQAVGDGDMYSLMSDLSSDVEYFLAGLLTVAFMYALTVMLIINSAVSFL